ncbi:hypothetical protein PAPHI01_0577 [Pancytospora philotis]|nr:hypothetical protein PAPHI01_0577 [Pancytospora philotis]
MKKSAPNCARHVSCENKTEAKATVCTKNKRRRCRVPEVVSMWRNPHSRLVPFDVRIRQKAESETSIPINLEYFQQLKCMLDAVDRSSSTDEDCNTA